MVNTVKNGLKRSKTVKKGKKKQREKNGQKREITVKNGIQKNSKKCAIWSKLVFKKYIKNGPQR